MASIEQIIDLRAQPAPPGESPWVVQPVPTTVTLAQSHPAWPAYAQGIAQMVRDALGFRALRVEHVGSTSVPELPAKPVIDCDLTVARPGRESVWLAPLEAAGFELRVREPWWHEHRCLVHSGSAQLWAEALGHTANDAEHADPVNHTAPPTVNLHVFGPDSPELVRHALFRDWLRANAPDRALYAAAKRAARGGASDLQTMMEYNGKKDPVIRQIYQRAFAAGGFLE